MRDEKTRELYAYWRRLKGQQRVPLRAGVDPRAIKPLLPNIFLLERIDRDLVIFRLAGTAICDAFGQEFKALNLLSLLQGDSRRLVRSLLDNVVMMPCPGLTIVRAETEIGRVFDCEVLFLPLADDAGNIRKVIGSAFAGETCPLDFGEKILRQEVIQIRMMTEEVSLTPPRESYPQLPRTGPAGAELLPEPILEKKHLKLVVSQEAPLVG